MFANYKSEPAAAPAVMENARTTCSAPTPSAEPLQTAIDRAVARGFLYRFLARAFDYPDADGWDWLSAPETQAAFRSAASALSADAQVGERLLERLQPQRFQELLDGYLGAFGHAARGPCPMNEIEYGDLKADPLFQPHRLADLAAFYRVFGLEIAQEATERQDHICLELEFMSVLAAREAFALEHQLDDDQLLQARQAQKQFLREHLGRWVPAFARRLARAVGAGVLAALADFTLQFVLAECGRFGVAPGSEDLLIRAIDAGGESICASCSVPKP